MRPFELTILGSNSAVPAYGRFTTSQVLHYNHHLYVIDCGEGAQIRMQQYKIKKRRIQAIFISHLHGDHIFGLPGLLTSFNHLDRKDQLTVIGPVGLKNFLDASLNPGMNTLTYPLTIREFDVKEEVVVYESPDLAVTAFPVVHRIPTQGYKFSEIPGQRNIRKDAIDKYNLSVDQIKLIKSGQDLIYEGNTILNSSLVHKLSPPRSYAYCADSQYDPSIIPYIKDTDVIYFETTYLDELKENAHERMHATAKEAATLAKKANAGMLITGHYSSRYKDVLPLVNEAKQYFDHVVMGYDGAMFEIGNYTNPDPCNSL